MIQEIKEIRRLLVVRAYQCNCESLASVQIHKVHVSMQLIRRNFSSLVDLIMVYRICGCGMAAMLMMTRVVYSMCVYVRHVSRKSTVATVPHGHYHTISFYRIVIILTAL